MSTLLDALTYLGAAADGMDEHQIRQFQQCGDLIDQRYPEGGKRHEQAMEAALRVVTGEAPLQAFSESWRTAAKLERLVMAALTGAIIASIVSGETEVAVAESAQVHRATVRRALGK